MDFEVLQLADGWTGTDQTVAKASQLIRDSLMDPVVVTTAQNIVRYVTERDKDAQIRAISRWVREHVRYLNEGAETLKSPRYMLDEIKKYGIGLGDCDDFTILLGALYRSIGLNVRAKVVSQRQDRYASHIFLQVFSPKRGWVTDDAIVKDKPLGWEMPARQQTKNRIYPMNGLGGATMSRDFWAGGVINQSEFLPPQELQFARQMISPFDASNVKTGGALEVCEDGSVSGVGDDIFSSLATLATKGLEVAAAKFQTKANKAAMIPSGPIHPAGGDLMSNPAVQLGALALAGFVGYKLLKSFDII